jgi:hypothetical protein
MQVAMFLERKGFDAVYNLMGGVEAWAGEVDPACVVTEDGMKTRLAARFAPARHPALCCRPDAGLSDAQDNDPTLPRPAQRSKPARKSSRKPVPACCPA